MKIDETAEVGALRELMEETSFQLTHLKQFGTFTDVNRDPRERVITIAYYALARKSDVQGGDDAADAKWFPLNDVPPLAFDHDYILRKAMQQLKRDIHFEPIGFDLLDEQFTIPELQRLYEAILGIHFDRRNFYKKMLQTGILNEVDDELGSDYDTLYYGDKKEMRSRNIDELFGGSRSLNMAEPIQEEGGRRKKGTRFSFNKRRYDQLKEDNNFRLEF